VSVLLIVFQKTFLHKCAFCPPCSHDALLPWYFWSERSRAPVKKKRRTEKPGRDSCAFVHVSNCAFHRRRSIPNSSFVVFEDIRGSDISEPFECSSRLFGCLKLPKAVRGDYIVSMHGNKLQFKTKSGFHMEILVFE